MSLQVGELYAKLVLEKSKFESDLHHSEHAAKGWGSRTKSAFAGAAKAIVTSLAVVGAFVIAIGEKAIEAAETQERAEKKVQAVYGDWTDDVMHWSEKASAALGVHDDELENSIGQYGLWAKNLGRTNEVAIKQGEDLAKRASEISLATGASFTDVFNSLMKGEQGATRGLKTYGVAVSTAAIKAEALRLGLYKGKGALSDSAKAAALHSLIMKQTAKYTGIAADMQDSLALKTRRASAVINQVMDVLGVAFMDVVGGIIDLLLPAFQSMKAWVDQNGPAIQQIMSNVMDGIRGAFDTAMKAVQPFIDMVSDLFDKFVEFLNEGDNMTYFLQALGIIVAVAIVPPFLAWAAATVAATLPIIILIGVVFAIIKVLNDLGLVGPIVAAATKIFGDAMDWVGTTVVPMLQGALDWLVKNVLPPLQAALSWFTTNVLPLFGAAFDFITTTVMPAIGAAFDWFVKNVVPPLQSILQGLVDNVLPLVTGAFDFLANTVFPTVRDAIQFVVGKLQELWDAITNNKDLMNFLKEVANAIGTGFQLIFQMVAAAWDIIQKFFQAVLTNENVMNTLKLVAEAIHLAFEGVAAAVSFVITQLQNLVSFIQQHLSDFEILLKILSGNPTAALDIVSKLNGGSNQPGNAQGTPWFGGGWARVGERGPELVRLPRGSAVYSNPESQRMERDAVAGSGGLTINVPITGLIRAERPADIGLQMRRLASLGVFG